MEEYKYELLVIDTDGKSQIKTVRALSHAITGSDVLWCTPQIESKQKYSCIKDKNIETKITKMDDAESITNIVESVFLIEIISTDFSALEKIRYPFLLSLRKIGFSNIRVLTDDISTEISCKIYPIINKVENSLRRYIALFFTLKIGVKWFGVTVPQATQTKIAGRKDNEQIFSKLIDTDVRLIDFDDLGEIIYKQNTGFNKQENIIDKIMRLNTPEDIRQLQSDIQNNYNKYFKETFQTNAFEKKWKSLFEIRNKVAHNNLFLLSDLDTAQQLESELIGIIESATKKINSFKFSIEEQESIVQATIDSEEAKPQNENDANAFPDTNINDSKIINERESSETEVGKYISQDQIVDLLNQMSNYKKYIGLKYFATVVLPQKGYTAVPVNYAVINLLKNKQIVKIYDEEDQEHGYQVKAIALLHNN